MQNSLKDTKTNTATITTTILYLLKTRNLGACTAVRENVRGEVQKGREGYHPASVKLGWAL